MRINTWALFGAGMFGLGVFIGGAGPLTSIVSGQDANTVQSADDKVRAASKAIKEAADALAAEQRYDTITEGSQNGFPNAFLVLAGGGKASEDLEAGVVDPETFAALYAGMVKKEVKDQLQKDEQGRLTYNGNVIRMYPKSRLEKIFVERTKSSTPLK